MLRIIFFHPRPHTLVPGAEILFSHLAGDDLSSVIITRDISGPLPVMVSDLLSELRTRLTITQERHDARLKTSKLEVPEEAMREALLNALIHRKYTIVDAVKVALFSDRLEIFSPGNFPGPITDLRSGVSYTRNPTVRQLARKSGLVEKRGWGFQLIFAACKKNQNPEPRIEEGADFVRVTFWRRRIITETGESELSQNLERQRELPSHLVPLIPLLNTSTSFQTLEVMTILACSENTARARIRELVKMGIVMAEGQGRGRRYVVIREKRDQKL